MKTRQFIPLIVLLLWTSVPIPMRAAQDDPTPQQRLDQILADWQVVVDEMPSLSRPHRCLACTPPEPTLEEMVANVQAYVDQLTPIEVLDSRLVANLEGAMFGLDDAIEAQCGERFFHADITQMRTDLDAWPNW